MNEDSLAAFARWVFHLNSRDESMERLTSPVAQTFSPLVGCLPQQNSPFRFWLHLCKQASAAKGLGVRGLPMKMLKNSLLVMSLGVAGLLIPSQASAALVVGDQFVVGNGDGFSPGGVFLLDNIADGIGTGEIIATFCLELHEPTHSNLTQVFEVYDTSGAADAGGVGGTPDPIDPLTAVIYQEFLAGGASFTANVTGYSAASADEKMSALQYAIWVIEQEIPDFNPLNAPNSDFANLATLAQNVYNWAVGQDALAKQTAKDNTSAVNSIFVGGDLDDQLAQSFLQAAAPVPEPGSMLLLGSGLMGLGAAARRRLKNRKA